MRSKEKVGRRERVGREECALNYGIENKRQAPIEASEPA